MGIVAARAQVTYSLIVNSQLLSNSNCYSSSRHDINRVMLLHVSFVPVPLVCVSFFSVRRLLLFVQGSGLVRYLSLTRAVCQFVKVCHLELCCITVVTA